MTNEKQLRAEWNNLAPAWIQEMRSGRNPMRAGMLDRYMLELCGDVRGLSVLDCGCGEGRFCRMLAERGASKVLGLDTCEPMLVAARDIACDREEYRVTDVEDLGCISDASFDLAVSYLNHCDLVDFKANVREVFRVLRPGGKFVVCNLHPMRSAVGGWHRSPDGSKLHAILDRYFNEGPRKWRMLNCDFTNFHRTLETYVNGFLQAGFVLERFVEPTVTPEDLAAYPEIDDEIRAPNFVIWLLRKPAEGV
ncbi:MAG: class I SAM-dependent methyltransferase [Planctomycetota bacterium]